MNHAAELLLSLTKTHGLTGRESAVGQLVVSVLAPIIPDVTCNDGLVTAHMGNDPEKPTLLLCAHLDQVGFLVTHITEDGFLNVGTVGGIDRRLLLGQSVTVAAPDGDLSGVICILPPHVLHGEQAVPSADQIYVDIGCATKEAAASLVPLGTPVYYATEPQVLLHDRMTAPALDDRSGVAALVLTAEALAGEELPCNVTFCFSDQEERGGRGAWRIAQTEIADYAIAVDVTFGTGHGDSTKETYVMGGGAAVGISPVLSASLSDALLHVAETANIPVQIEVMPATTGTDADKLALLHGGCQAGTVSIPLQYMHTPVEVIDLNDLTQTAALLAAYARECGKQ